MTDRNSPADAERIVLVRAGSGDGPCFSPFAGDGAAASLVFLHGDAVALADGELPLPASVPRVVCSTSWRRRHPDRSPPPPFEVSTLAVLIDRLAGARTRIDSHGLGGACCSPSGASGPWLLEIAFAPASDRQAVETLEMALAAAALELEFQVLFSSSGPAHLCSGSGRSWRQLTDFGMAGLFAEATRPDAAWQAEASPLSPPDAARLRGAARQWVLL